MKRKLLYLILLAVMLFMTGCGDTTPVITEINIYDENGVEVIADEIGTYRTGECTIEVFFSGDVQKISFFAVKEDEYGELEGEYLASAEVGKGIERALYDWELPFNFIGYIWVVLNDDRSVFSESNSQPISSVMEIIAPYVVFSCEYNGSPLQIMLYQPVEKGTHGIWAVESYKDADGIHPYEFVSNEYIKTKEEMYELDQNTANILGGDPNMITPDGVALTYLLDKFSFVPESFELSYQRDNTYR